MRWSGPSCAVLLGPHLVELTVDSSFVIFGVPRALLSPSNSMMHRIYSGQICSRRCIGQRSPSVIAIEGKKQAKFL
jgi:hypothetical protein